MFIGTLYGIAQDQESSAILSIVQHFVIPGRPYLDHKNVLLSGYDFIIHAESEGHGIAFMFAHEFAVEPDFAIIINIGEIQLCIAACVCGNFEFLLVPPGSLIEIAQFAAEIGLLCIDQLQMLELEKIFPFGDLIAYGDFKIIPVKTENLALIVYILKNLPTFFEIDNHIAPPLCNGNSVY